MDGRFWYPRSPRTPWLVPDRVVLAWPEFQTATGGWIPVDELCEATVVMEDGFTNAGEETLFDAIRSDALRELGRSSSPQRSRHTQCENSRDVIRTVALHPLVGIRTSVTLLVFGLVSALSFEIVFGDEFAWALPRPSR